MKVFGYWLNAHSHTEDEYRDVLASYPQGTTLYLLYAQDFEPNYRGVPAAYQDLLPKSMRDVEAALARGETVEAEGKARGFRVVLLAASTQKALDALIKTTKLLPPLPPATDRLQAP